VKPHRLDGSKFGFNKGTYFVGENRVLENGTQLVAILSELRVGLKKWRDGQMVDDAMGLVAEGFVPPRRSDLDDYDSTSWEVQPDGSTKDPWTPTNELPMISIKDNEILTYCTSSKGGFGAIGALCAEFVLETGMYPIVELRSSSYMHKTRAYGRIFVPEFPVLKYVAAELYDAILAASRSGAGASTAATAPKPIEAALGNDNDNGGYDGDDGGHRGPVDDDIPF
jgi:hypothetical protein